MPSSLHYTRIQDDVVQASKLAVSFVNRQRCDNANESFCSCIVTECEDITDEPTLPHQRWLPRRIDDDAPAHVFDSPKSYFNIEAFDLVIGDLQHRFHQERKMPVAAVIEKILLDAAQNVSITDLLDIYKDLCDSEENNT